MATVRRVDDLRAATAAWRRAGLSIGLVPTMGALHGGHLALIRAARAACARVVATIFVNPAQFDNPDDLERYPRDRARDEAMLSGAGVDLLFAPAVDEMYPDGFATSVAVSGLSACLCGVSRPGHLAGVTTVVAKLLVQAQPDIAYFGEKDYQQLLVVRRMARDLDLPVRIDAVATERAADGLAHSSRNACLSADERARAPALYRILRETAARLSAGGAAAPVLERGRGALSDAGFAPIDYLELRDGETLAELTVARPPARLFAAAWLGTTRLIDNVRVAG